MKMMLKQVALSTSPLSMLRHLLCFNVSTSPPTSARLKRLNLLRKPFSRLPQIKRDLSDSQSSTKIFL